MQDRDASGQFSVSDHQTGRIGTINNIKQLPPVFSFAVSKLLGQTMSDIYKNQEFRLLIFAGGPSDK